MSYLSYDDELPEDIEHDAHASLYRMLYGSRWRQEVLDDYMEAERADEDQDREEEDE